MRKTHKAGPNGKVDQPLLVVTRTIRYEGTSQWIADVLSQSLKLGEAIKTKDGYCVVIDREERFVSVQVEKEEHR